MSEESLVLGLGEKCRTLKYFKVRGVGRASEQKCNTLPKKQSLVIYYLHLAIFVCSIFQANKGYKTFKIYIRQCIKGRPATGRKGKGRESCSYILSLISHLLLSQHLGQLQKKRSDVATGPDLQDSRQQQIQKIFLEDPIRGDRVG